MALTIEPREMADAQAWEFTHQGVTYRLVSYNGSDKVDLFWLHNGQPVPHGSRKVDGWGPRVVAARWAEEIARPDTAQEWADALTSARPTGEDVSLFIANGNALGIAVVPEQSDYGVLVSASGWSVVWNEQSGDWSVSEPPTSPGAQLPTAGDYRVLGWIYSETKNKFLVLGHKVEDGTWVFAVGEVDEIDPSVPLRGTQFATRELAVRAWQRRVEEVTGVPTL